MLFKPLILTAREVQTSTAFASIFFPRQLFRENVCASWSGPLMYTASKALLHFIIALRLLHGSFN
jgi:hypothetical protein